MTTVAEEGNKRVGDATIEEVTQCAKDIRSWFERTGCISRSASGSDKSEFQRLAKATELSIPDELIALLTTINGEIWYMNKKLLSVDDILKTLGELDSCELWKPYYIPICGDSSELIIINTRTDNIMEWDEDDGAGEIISTSFASFLETYRDELLSGHFEYLDDCGVIEKMTKSKK